MSPNNTISQNTYASPVFVRELKLSTFRNYTSVQLDFDERHVVLTGENGSGKTNLMEAVSFLSPGRGLRRAKYDQVGQVSFNGAWTVFTQMEGAQGPVKIGTGLQETATGVETSRRVRINGTAIKTSDELLDHSRIVWLTPSMDGLFTGGASDRRKFIDRLVLAIDPLHGRRVGDFEKAMRSRNKLLSHDMPDPQWLDALETQMAELGTAIVAARMELIEILSSAIIANHEESSPFPDAIVGLQGNLESTYGDMPTSDLEAEYAVRLKNNRMIDRSAGRTLEGPHRSDLKVSHRPKNMAAELCSTGEQKALLVGMLLAHAKLTASMNGFPPILLLDEIAAHLDAGRRAALFDMIDALGCQSFMTGTDKSLFDAMGSRGNFFDVSNGSVTNTPL